NSHSSLLTPNPNTQTYTLSLHDALPIFQANPQQACALCFNEQLDDLNKKLIEDYEAKVEEENKASKKSESDIKAENSSDSDATEDRKSTRLNSSHVSISYAVFCLNKKTI